ncbi:hypothetical protein U1707_15740 [Sphingomonas sp. PB2P12]|uniref:hypothetical protein n=1 Tax=Sphingomonas sandaracina TaxID=3096157 RepID=UPI002FCC01FB
MLKTLWNMPAKIWRDDAADDKTAGNKDAGEPVASGSLADMVRAFDGYDDAETLMITCAGRDRPITAAEVRDLRRNHAATAPARD